MKKNIVSILTFAACAAVYGVEIYDNTSGYNGVHYIYNSDETISASIDGSVNGYPTPDWIKINYGYSGSIKNPDPINITVEKGVNLTANTSLVLQNSVIKFLGNNNVNIKNLDAKYAGKLYAENANVIIEEFNLKTKGTTAEIKGGSFKAGSLSLDDTTTLILDGVKDVKVGYMTKSGAMGSSTVNESNLILKNGSTMTIERANKYDYIFNIGTNVRLESGSVLNVNSKIDTNSEIYVGSGASLNVAGSLKTRQSLTVASDAKVSTSGSITFDSLVLEFDENITQDLMKDFDFSSIFGESATVVTASLDNFSVVGTNGTFDASFDHETGGVVVPSAPVPEPATCAAIFGAFALAFAAYRRRR